MSCLTNISFVPLYFYFSFAFSMPQKVAIVHYWLTNMRGGERVLEALCELFPEAVIFTNVVNRKILPASIAKHEIRTTFIQKIPGSQRHYQKLLPLMPIALEQLDLSEFDLVISNESGPAKGVITRSDALHICYCFSPMRYLWDMYPEYLKSSNFLIRLFMVPCFHYLRLWDVATANRVDNFLTISHAVKARVKRWWKRDSEVLYPPVDLDRLEATSDDGFMSPFGDEPYYVYLGALVPYKRADLAIDVCRNLGKNLLVIGNGSEFKKLKEFPEDNIKFITNADDKLVKQALSTLRHFFFPERRILVLLFLKPWLPYTCDCYRRGGAIDTVTEDTGLFFLEQTKESLAEAIAKFENIPENFWKKENFLEHVNKFSKENFKKQFLEVVLKQLKEKKNN
ncbi:MAG: hypothetical protein ACLRRK_11685 [Parasutterella sp.]